jgi:hypothetical protein
LPRVAFFGAVASADSDFPGAVARLALGLAVEALGSAFFFGLLLVAGRLVNGHVSFSNTLTSTIDAAGEQGRLSGRARRVT